MNKFELFSLIFYAIDLYYDEHPSEELGQFLSEMSPFTFKQICSADPAVYSTFCNFVGERKIEVENSFEIAMEYIHSINEIDLQPIFKDMDEKKWVDGCRRYLAKDHKGADN